MNRRQLLKALPAAAAALSFAPSSFAAAPRAGGAAKPRIRSALCAYSYRDALASNRMTYEDLVDIAVENDIDGLDLTVYWFPAWALKVNILFSPGDTVLNAAPPWAPLTAWISMLCGCVFDLGLDK